MCDRDPLDAEAGGVTTTYASAAAPHTFDAYLDGATDPVTTDRHAPAVTGDVWAIGTPLPSGRNDLGVVAVQGLMYVMGPPEPRVNDADERWVVGDPPGGRRLALAIGGVLFEDHRVRGGRLAGDEADHAGRRAGASRRPRWPGGAPSTGSAEAGARRQRTQMYQ